MPCSHVTFVVSVAGGYVAGDTLMLIKNTYYGQVRKESEVARQEIENQFRSRGLWVIVKEVNS